MSKSESVNEAENIARKWCSECGQSVSIMTNAEDYLYKVHAPHQSKDSRVFQCSYTCYTHAQMRLLKSKNKDLSKENWIKYVLRSERAMKSQGKTILHPIEIKDGKK